MKKPIKIIAVIFSFGIPGAVMADTGFQAGNILVSTGNTVYEYTSDGILVTQVPVPASPDNETVRDITMLEDGRLAVFNGTFLPALSVFDGVTWTNLSVDGWSVPNNLSYGGIASIDGTVFVTDGFTYNGGEGRGLIAIDMTNGTNQRFADSSDYIDITLGRDGLLYALRSVYGALDVVDPATFTILRSVDLGHTSGSRGVIANADGMIYMISWDGYIAHYDSDGVLLNTLFIGGDLHDIDMDDTGRLIVGSRFGQVYITDESLSTFNEITVGSTNTFVAFVTPLSPIDVPAPPVLSGTHKKRGRHIHTTLTWTTEASGVDVYFNGELIDTVSGTNTATYAFFKNQSQVFMVCNTGTSDCSSEYVAN